MFHDIKTVLILAPHPDDAEFGLGGTINRLVNMDKEIHVAVFSTCEASTPEGFEVGVIEKEMYESLQFLGIHKENIHMFDFPVRKFPEHRQEILETLIELRNKLNPELIFTPSSSDIHQDHAQIHIESIRAFKHNNILGYEMPWNNFDFKSLVYINLSQEDIQRKIEALKIYESQAFRPYSNINFVESLAQIRATQIRENYAESFELIRYIQY